MADIIPVNVKKRMRISCVLRYGIHFLRLSYQNLVSLCICDRVYFIENPGAIKEGEILDC